MQRKQRVLLTAKKKLIKAKIHYICMYKEIIVKPNVYVIIKAC